MKPIHRIALLCVAMTLLFGLMHSAVTLQSSAASANQFSAANASIIQAFTSTRDAVGSGANGSLLISKLNAALDLLQKANLENASNPAQASVDLANATAIAQQVVIQSQDATRSGANARAVQRDTSVGAALAIVAVTISIYVYGERVYRRLWLRIYRDHVVRTENEYE